MVFGATRAIKVLRFRTEGVAQFRRTHAIKESNFGISSIHRRKWNIARGRQVTSSSHIVRANASSAFARSKSFGAITDSQFAPRNFAWQSKVDDGSFAREILDNWIDSGHTHTYKAMFCVHAIQATSG